MGEITLGTLYDFNKQAMKNEKPLNNPKFNIATSKMVEDMIDRAEYWMLLNNERKDYTVFKILTEEGILNEIRPTLKNRGDVLSIDKLKDGNYEIWIRDSETKDNFIYYLFDYTFGVIEA